MKLIPILIAGLGVIGLTTSHAQTQPATTSGTTVRPAQPSTQPASTTPVRPSTTPPSATSGTMAPSGITQPANPVQPGTNGNAAAPANPYATQPGSNPAQMNAQPGNDFQRSETATGTNSALQTTSPAAQPSTTFTPSNNGTQISPLQADQIPNSLRQTLQGDMYKGWENSTIYYDRSTNEYSMDLDTEAGARSYRFDDNGNAIEEATPDGDQ
jgi:hypothetical protein